MNDPDESLAWANGMRDDLSERFFAYDDFTAIQDRPAADLSTGLVSLGFIRSALRRSAWFWCATAIAGLLIGYGMYTRYPPAYHATASVLLTDDPTQDPAVESQTDVSLAESQAVAGHVVQQLGLQQTVGSLQAAYTVTPVSDQVLVFNVGAPSSVDAVHRAAALATDFLQFRADYVQNQHQELVAELDQQFNQAQQALNSISAQITQIPAQPSSPAQQAKLYNLLTQRSNENQIEQYVTGTIATTQTTTKKMVEYSEVIDPAVALPRSHLKSVAFYLAAGLIAGLAVGMGIAVVLALISDRLRRRDDIAAALGAPVRLSVGALRRRRWLPLPGRAAKRNLNLGRVVAHLRAAVPGSSRGPASLAIVAVDNAAIVASAVATLAVSYGSQGKQVVVADLSEGGHVARLLGVKDPGVHALSQDGARLTVTIPDRDDVAPVGPLVGVTPPSGPAQADEALVAACASANLLFTLATLDPAFGADHLATWATDAVVVVTAGQSSAERVQGVGEMIRLAGTRLESAVLIGADKSDRSLGVGHSLEQSVPAEPVR